MTGITIGVIVLIMLIVGFIFGRSRRISGVEADRIAKDQERESWVDESVMSYAEVQKLRDELIKRRRKMSDELIR